MPNAFGWPFKRSVNFARAYSLPAGKNSLVVLEDQIFEIAPPSGGTGEQNTTIGGVTVSGVGALAIKGIGSATIGGITVVGTGEGALPGITGSQSATIGGASVAGTGKLSIKGSQSITIGGVFGSGSGSLAIDGQHSGQIGGMSVSGAGKLAITGQGAAIVGSLIVSGSGVNDNQVEPAYPVAENGAMAIGASKPDWSSARFLFDPSRLQRSKPDQETQKFEQLSETIETAKASASPQMVRALIDLRRLLDAQRAAYLAPQIIVIQPSIQVEAPAPRQINPAIVQLIAEML